MPKRDATTELNHDNWDQEDESEEAGEFKKASDDQMKGRVIKKAKRRNLTEDQKKNIFASFGGFTSSNNVNAADAFSFLAASQTKTESNGSQEESTKNGAEESIPSKTDDNKENDTNTKAETPAPVDDLFAKFMKPKTGSWTCEVCMVSNPADRDTCLACEAPRPGAVDKSKANIPKVDPPPPPADDLFAKFMKPKIGSWTCEVCMVSNPADRDTCIACEAPRPGAVDKSKANIPKIDPPPTDDLFAKFMKPKTGSWTCEVCMVSNPADRDTCIACESPRPGATIKAKDDSSKKEQTPSFQFGESGGFKFGSTTSTTNDNQSVGGFKFGDSSKTDTNATTSGFSFGVTPSTETKETGGFKFGSATETKEESKSVGGFTFGSTASTEKVEEAKSSSIELGGFKFGSSSETKEESKPVGGFMFGSTPSSDDNKMDDDKSSSKDLGGFKFGSTSETKEESKTNGGFSFGSSAPKSDASEVAESKSSSDSGFLFGSSTNNTTGTKGFQFSDKMGLKMDVNSTTDTPKTKSKKGEYLSNLKALNTQVTSWIKSHVDQNPLIDLTPVFNDYEKHIGELKTKYGIKPSSAINKSEIKEASKALSFGSSSAPSPFTSTLGTSQSPFGSAPTTGFSFGFLKNNENKQEDTKEDKTEGEGAEEATSPQKPSEPVVEEDALYTKKCKLFYKKGDAYIERGLGNIHLKHTEDKKLQLIIRAGTSLGNILLNILVTSSTPLERLGNNNVMLVTVPNPPLDKKNDQAPVTFLIRVKTAEDADTLKQKISDLCKNE